MAPPEIGASWAFLLRLPLAHSFCDSSMDFMDNESDKPTPATQTHPPPLCEIEGPSPATKEPPSPMVATTNESARKDSKETHEHNISHPKWEFFERCVKVAEAIAFISTIAAAVFVGYQWREMVEASHIADRQLDEMRITRKDEERAWVAITVPISSNFTITPSGERTGVDFVVPYKNTGRTPAINVVPYIGGYSDIKLVPPKDPYPNPVYHSMLVPPDGSYEIPTIGLASDTLIYQRVKSGDPYYLAGTIWYDDVFGRHHWTQFCFLVNSDFNSITPTAIHNTCDDAQATMSQQNSKKLP